MTQLAITARDNKNLFSNYYLDNQLKNNPEWKKEDHKQYLQIKSIADVYTAVYFGNETTEVNKNPKFAYNDLFWALKGDDKEWSRKKYKPWFKSAMEIARDKSFVHWELEFPEIFFEGGAPKENPGWDAVVGNPPYVSQEQLTPNKEYFKLNYEVYHGVADLYVYFFEHGYLRFISQYLVRIPIRHISFTTPADRRAALVEQAKALYSEFLGAQGADNLDRINRIDRINASNPVNPVNPVHAVVSLSAAPDSQKILEFIGARLSAAPEESDVVHDLLAFLAQRMIEMNKEKNAEIKGFLRWFEEEIGAPIEELTNKTAIKEYYEAGFDALAGALAKNKKKLKDGYDPTRREPKEKLQAEFNVSVGKLAPLLKRIEATDGLIDQIVYRLYGLTEEEIKIVEKSI